MTSTKKPCSDTYCNCTTPKCWRETHGPAIKLTDPCQADGCGCLLYFDLGDNWACAACGVIYIKKFFPHIGPATPQWTNPAPLAEIALRGAHQAFQRALELGHVSMSDECVYINAYLVGLGDAKTQQEILSAGSEPKSRTPA